MTTTIKVREFVFPTATICLRNIQVDVNNFTFTADLGVKESGKRKFEYESISGKLCVEIKEWLSKLTSVKVKVKADNPEGFVFMETAEKSTGFHKYLKKRGIEISKDVLKSLVFESENDSDDYQTFPFKIVKYLSGHYSLNLVNVAPKKKTEIEDPGTGEIKTIYSQQYFEHEGKVQKQYFAPKNFKRLVIETIKDQVVEMAE